MTDPKVPRDLTDEVGLLRRAVDDLSGLFREILKRTEDAEESIGRSRTAIKWAWGIALFDLFLTVVLVVGGLLLSDAQDELETLTADLQRSMRNQCAQLAVFLGSYRPESRPPETRAEYERTFESLRFQFKDLGCDPATVTRPIPTPAPAPTR